MPKPLYKDILIEYSLDIGDLSLSLFIPSAKNAEYPEEHTPYFLHTHSYVEIFVCTGEELRILTEYGVILLYEHDIALIPTDSSHSAMSGKNINFFTMGISGSQNEHRNAVKSYREFSDFFSLNHVRIYRNAKNIEALLREITDSEYAAHSPIPTIKTAAMLAELAKLKNYEMFDTPYESIKRFPNRNVSRFLSIENIIYSSYNDSISCDDIAAKLYLTRRHLDRIIKERYGKTLRELIIETRVKISKQMLEQTEKSIDDVAQSVGFPSTTSFKYNFITLVGISPSKYRKKKRDRHGKL